MVLAAGGRSFIGALTRVRGTLRCGGTLMVLGSLEGEGHVKGDLLVPQGGRVEADVEARSVELAGEARGSIRAEGCVRLEETALFEGEIQAASLQVRPGSILRGRTRVMGDPSSTRPPLSH
ncbi:MAG TPA: polymer-forming cytoskeletal protein [Candidatus Polarisedimenticolia bacterium]|nr:polymer-forming cytoskeletal protein [Candidatus Polarisedimenticolia bacterium]